MMETLVLGVLIFGVLMGATYAVFRFLDSRDWIAYALVALAVVGFVFLLVTRQGWIEPVDAFACSDQSEILIVPDPGPGAGGGGVEEWDFLNCTVYWYVG